MFYPYFLHNTFLSRIFALIFTNHYFFLKIMKKLILSLIIAMVSTGMMAQKQDAKSQKRINEIREMYSNCMNYINENANGSASDYWPIKVEARVNEAAVGVVVYDYLYVPMEHVGGKDFLRMKRTVTVFPADVEEFVFDGDTPAFYYNVERSYHEQGQHTDTRIYFYPDGSLCRFTRDFVKADGSKTALPLSDDDIKEKVKAVKKTASEYVAKCQAFSYTESENDD